MDEKLKILQLGALLHDIGKIVRRAGEAGKTRHSEAGVRFLKNNRILLPKYDEIYDMVGYHHYEELEKYEEVENKKLSENSLAYVVYEADNIASGIDRINRGKDEDKGNEKNPLNSIFNKIYLNKNNKEKIFDMEVNKFTFNMPRINDKKNLDASNYQDLLRDLKDILGNMKDFITPEKLVSVLEETCIYFPSSSYVDYPDVSYYDHVKLTSAVAACLYLYDIENGIENFKSEYYENNNNKKARKKEKFLFVSGEFTGIQNFIYLITSKMAMKSLRGRSFYLELFIEHIIDEILSALELSRANLIYSGGSQFYLLLPNIKKSKEILENFKEIINDFLLEESGTSIYFEISYILTNAENLGNGLGKQKTENKIGEIFRETSIKTSKSKLSRYSVNQLEKLFDENSSLNEVHDSTKECVICKKSEKKEILEMNSERTDTGNQEICNMCRNYINLGKEISRMYHTKNQTFIVEKIENKKTSKLMFPRYPEGYVNIEFLNKEKMDLKSEYRFYSINDDYFEEGEARNIKIGNYNVKNNIENKEDKTEKDALVEFKDLISKGIDRLAVFRADVDSLGTLFQRGFINEKNEEKKYENVKLSKSVVVSRYLSDFFKRKINLILEKKNAAEEENEIFKKYCDVINKGNNKPREIVVVYSGGDDIFAIGTWNDIIEFSVDLRTAFKEFTNEKITMSAGIGFFHDNFPVYQMAQRTGELEKLAKSYSKDNSEIPTKDAVALFGKEKQEKLNHVYDWDTFIDKVLNEKYSYLKSKVTFEENENSEKIFVGKSKWYKLMELIRSLFNDEKEKRIDIARFAYVLARIKNNERNKENYLDFKKKLFNWIKDSEEARQLLTAINIIIYEERGE